MKNLYAKLLKLNQELQPIKKDLENPYFHSNYADINKIIGEVRPKLTKLGLVVLQPLTSMSDGKPAIETIIIDTESGESFGEGKLYPLIEMNDIQKAGGVATYSRRYSLLSLFLLETEDDDGNSASGKVSQAQASPTYQKPAYQKSTYKPYQAPVQKVANDEVDITNIPFN